MYRQERCRPAVGRGILRQGMDATGRRTEAHLDYKERASSKGTNAGDENAETCVQDT